LALSLALSSITPPMKCLARTPTLSPSPRSTSSLSLLPSASSSSPSLHAGSCSSTSPKKLAKRCSGCVPTKLPCQAAIDAEKATKSTANFIDIWKDPVDRRRTLLSIAAISTQAASGAMFMIAYGTYFFQMAHVGSPFMNSCILVAVGVVAIIANSCVISKIGRRRVFLMSGLTICGLCQIAVAAVYHVNPGTVSTGKVRSRHLRIFALRCVLIEDRPSLGSPSSTFVAITA
jgi:hypothetical protein